MNDQGTLGSSSVVRRFQKKVRISCDDFKTHILTCYFQNALYRKTDGTHFTLPMMWTQPHRHRFQTRCGMGSTADSEVVSNALTVTPPTFDTHPDRRRQR